MSHRWYVVQTKYELEQFATDQLRNQDHEVFYPAYKDLVMKRGKLSSKYVELVRPLYPSYIFARFDIKGRQWRSINNTRGVLKILGSGEDHASPLPFGFVEDMVNNLDKFGHVDLQNSMKNLIQASPEAEQLENDSDFNKLVDKAANSKAGRVTVLLSLLNNKIKLALPVDHSLSPAE